MQTATSVSALGDLDAVGAKFAKSRNAQLISASQRDSEGTLIYTLDLQGDTYRELLLLTISKGRCMIPIGRTPWPSPLPMPTDPTPPTPCLN